MQVKKKEVLLKEIIKILDDNKAKDIVTINLANKSSIADYMIVASGTSSRHIQSVSENTIEELKKMKFSGLDINDCIKKFLLSSWKSFSIDYFDKKKGAITLDDNIQKSIIYMNIGSSYIAIKQFDKAVTSLNQALQLARANDDGYRAALTLGRLGLIDMKYERFKAAEAKFKEAISLSDSPISKSYALVTLGKVYYYDNQKEKAIERLEEGLALSQSVGWNELVMDSAELLDVIYKEKGNYKLRLFK